MASQASKAKELQPGAAEIWSQNCSLILNNAVGRVVVTSADADLSQFIMAASISQPVEFGTARCDGRVCLVTGSSRGLGLAVATELAKRGGHLVLVCRNPAKGQRAEQLVRDASGSDQVESLVADLRSQRSIREAVEEFHKRHGSLHVLIHNAAVVPSSRRITEDNIEEQFAVNHLAPFLLTHLLLDKLKASAPARVVVVASQLERDGEIQFEDLTMQRSYDPLAAYCRSKLANVLYTYKLASELRGTNVTANCLHPGVIDTSLLETLRLIDLANEMGVRTSLLPLLRFVQRRRTALGDVLRRLGLRNQPANRRKGPLSTSEGARNVVRLVVDPKLVGVSGQFFQEWRDGESSPTSRDERLADKLWEVSAALAGLTRTPDFEAGTDKETH